MARENATALKLLVIGIVGVVLLVPLASIDALLEGRQHEQLSAEYEIASSWGEAQTVVGPVLVVPHQRTDSVTGPHGPIERVVEYNIFMLPNELAVTAKLVPESRKRGIFESTVYRADLHIHGTFSAGSLEKEQTVAGGEANWDRAFVSVSLSGLNGIEKVLHLEWNGAARELVPGSGLEHAPVGLRAFGVKAWTGNATVDTRFTVNGSSQIRVAPLGKNNDISIESLWPHPSFKGPILPQERQVSDAGFSGNWKLSHYARQLPQAWTGTDSEHGELSSHAVGVDLLKGVDNYRTVERSIKYGVLFIALIFITFFLFEILVNLRIHPVQYSLVGLALGLFFLLLLSLSEFTSFAVAYLASASLCTLLISMYSLSVLRSGKRTLFASGGLAASFSCLFVVLQLEDFALLAGSGVLFTVLGIVMWVTRRVDWYKRDNPDGQEPKAVG